MGWFGKRIKLGDDVRDTISGFSGVVIAITEWLNGCVRITVQPRALKDGKRIENDTFDIEQMERVDVVGAGAIRREEARATGLCSAAFLYKTLPTSLS